MRFIAAAILGTAAGATEAAFMAAHHVTAWQCDASSFLIGCAISYLIVRSGR